MTSQLRAFLARQWCVPESSLTVEMQPLYGGLESLVARARITPAQLGSRVPPDLVVKQLSGPLDREADVYEALWNHLERPPAVQMFGRDVCGDATYLYLEHAPSFLAWPWSDTALAAWVCRVLAQLHDAPRLSGEAFSWNYQDELIRAAEDTLNLAATVRNSLGRRVWRRLGDLRRVVRALPGIRRRLLSQGTTVIHGDMHPGNVILRRTKEPTRHGRGHHLPAGGTRLDHAERSATGAAPRHDRGVRTSAPAGASARRSGPCAPRRQATGTAAPARDLP